MDKKESKAYYFGGLVIGCCYLFLTVIFLLYVIFFEYELITILSIVVIMFGVNLCLVYDFIKAKRELKEELKK